MKVFVWLSILLAIVSWGAFGYLIWFTPPKVEGDLAITNITYAIISGALALGFSVGMVHYFFASLFQPKLRTVNESLQQRRLLLQSLRRGFLFALTLTGIVALNMFNLLNLLNAGLLVGIAILAEIYFSSR